MSKRSKNQSMYQPAQQQRLVQERRAAQKKGAKLAARKGAQVPAQPTRTVEQMTAGIRVLGFAVALLSMAGALYWAGSRNGSYSLGVLAGLLVLGILAGFGLFIAVRAKEIAQRVR